MTTRTALFALLAMWGVGGCLPATAQDTATEVSDEGEGGWTDRVWVRTAETGELPPGSMQVFLSDGTLITDSCWETYRLSRWEQVSDATIRWEEDGVPIEADIVSATDAELVLSLKLVGGAEEQRFVPADVPYVCPDMPR